MDKAIKSFNLALESQQDSIIDAIQALVQASYTDPQATQVFSQFRIVDDLLQQDCDAVFELLSNLLEQSVQLITLNFQSKKQQKIIYVQAVSKLAGQKICYFLISLIEKINVNIENQDIYQEKYKKLNADLQNFKSMKQQGMITIPPIIPQDDEDDIQDNTPQPIPQSSESSQISCILESSSSQTSQEPQDQDIQSLLTKTKTLISELQEQNIEFLTDKKILQTQLNVLLTYLFTVFTTQLDNVAFSIFLESIISNCQFLDILEILIFLQQKGYLIGNFLIVIIAAAVQKGVEMGVQGMENSAVLERILAYEKVKKFTFEMAGKRVKIDQKQVADVDKKVLLLGPNLSKYSSIISLESKDYRFYNSHLYKFKNQLKVSLDDKFVTNVVLEGKKNSSEKIDASDVKCGFNFLAQRSVQYQSQGQLFNPAVISYFSDLADNMKEISNLTVQIFQYRFQSISSCSKDYDTQSQKLLILNVDFSFVSFTSFIMSQIQQDILNLNKLESVDPLCNCIYSAYRITMQFLEMISNIQGEFLQLKFEYQLFVNKSLDFLNQFAQFNEELRIKFDYLDQQNKSKIQTKLLQQNMINFNQLNNNPLQIDFIQCGKQVKSLENEIQLIADFQYKVGQTYENNVNIISSSHCIFSFMPKFLSQFQIIKQAEAASTQQFIQAIQTCILIYKSLRDDIFVLKEGMKKKSQHFDRVDNDLSDDDFEENIFEIDSSRQQILASLLFNGKIIDQLIYFTERVLYGPIVEKQESLNLIVFIFGFLFKQNEDLQEKIVFPISLESFVIFDKINKYKGLIIINKLTDIFQVLAKSYFTEFKANDSLKHFINLFISQNINTRSLQAKLNLDCNDLKYHIQHNDEINNNQFQPQTPLVQHDQQAPIQTEEKSIHQSFSSSVNSESLNFNEFTTQQDEVLLDNFSKFYDQFGSSVCILRLTELLDFQFSADQIQFRIDELRRFNKYSDGEIREVKKLAAAGKTNLQISQQFYLTEKQVEQIVRK